MNGTYTSGAELGEGQHALLGVSWVVLAQWFQ
jgi:hypothetical protein